MGKAIGNKNMKKIKEHNYIIKNESGQIIIRSIRNTDLTFYKNWFKNSRINEEAVNTISEEQIEKDILYVAKMEYIFIVELNKKPCGEIVLWKDIELIILDKYYKKPYYSLFIKFYEDIKNSDIDDIFKFFIGSIKQIKIKIGSLYAFIHEKEEKEYFDIFLKNGFKYINKESYTCKNKYKKIWIIREETMKYFYPSYKKPEILIKNI